VAVGWGDVASAHYTTGAPDITVYFEATWPVAVHTALVRMLGWAIPATPWQAMLHAGAQRIPAGPSSQARASAQATLVACARSKSGAQFAARMRTPEAYDFTVESSLRVAAAVLAGDFEPGFETPARLLGADFALDLPGVFREDIAALEAA
jgi:short subunit dehydrogenase-like uncharacterized protein